MIHTLHDFIGRLLRSPKFFYAIVALLVVQAAWIALTARYPQAFDENYHLGLILLHMQQWLPFFTQQPPESSVYGAIVREPSYLYHYLMGFPYHLVRAVTDSETAQIIVLRFLNIAIFVAGLFVYRRLFEKLAIRRTLSNIVLLFFVLLPVVPQLAGQINYDNLMFLLTGLLFLLAVRYMALLRDSTEDAGSGLGLTAMQLIAVGTAGSLVKFPFAPIFLAIFVITAYATWRKFRTLRAVWEAYRASGQNGKMRTLAWSLLTVLMVFLFLERYGINLVQYHAPVPKCDKVLTIEECRKYSPWVRDYDFAAADPQPSTLGIAVYPAVWVHRMVYETMFSITSYFYYPTGTVTYVPYPPLTIANYTAWTVVLAGTAAAVRYWHRLWAMTGLRYLLLACGFYMIVLFLQNFAMYLHTGEAVAIHGRYLVPMYPVLLLPAALGLHWLFTEFHGGAVRTYQGLLALLVLLLFLHGGGIVGWIVRSDNTWYWQHIPAAAQANWYAKNVLYPAAQHRLHTIDGSGR